MKTQVVMERELFNKTIRQQSKTGFFSATDLIRAGNILRLNAGKALFDLNTYLKSQSNKEYLETLEASEGEVISRGKGRNAQTWVHPLLFVDIALSIDPKLKIEVYKWLFDSLLKYRNESGDSYKSMCGYLWVNHGDKKTFPKFIGKVCDEIRLACRIHKSDKKWEKATEGQLKLRDDIHRNIGLLANILRNNYQAVSLGIREAKNENT